MLCSKEFGERRTILLAVNSRTVNEGRFRKVASVILSMLLCARFNVWRLFDSGNAWPSNVSLLLDKFKMNNVLSGANTFRFRSLIWFSLRSLCGCEEKGFSISFLTNFSISKFKTTTTNPKNLLVKVILTEIEDWSDWKTAHLVWWSVYLHREKFASVGRRNWTNLCRALRSCSPTSWPPAVGLGFETGSYRRS